MHRNSRIILITGILVLIGGVVVLWFFFLPLGQNNREFNSQQALDDLEYQVNLGPRTPGSPGHRAVVEWIQTELDAAGWETETQETSYNDFPITNIIGKRAADPQDDWIILGAHFDTRFTSDKDPDPNNNQVPVPGANDGASGVAVLLELARSIPNDIDKNIWLVFFDEEDNGHIDGRVWAMGSAAFVRDLKDYPDAVVVVDMIGDADLNIYFENNSDMGLSAEIWAQAAALGYLDAFIPAPKYTIIDDHLPFVEAGIRAIDIIDFDFDYHHTTEDTIDKVSAESLGAVGETLLAWLSGMD